ncbi:hydrogen peroxide-inducible genes activator [Thalassomonas sp. M1454]|uniref:hydrogen peroxide-inducible genes activator n=1 Tax=Thalassomonas sp. M1454 TaxID=2594477 RepID=UPI001180AFC1|nr:hydrogen peroxide-inducible genes activator [Thalassomonas sp. M1454]TRX57299.1 hydrogen peroxide-inducible genes activator [Thalassomonas sp. M1454]
MNIHLPNLKHLQYLIALDEYQHFHKAAESCFVSQSTLSSAIIKLEQLFDCQLIERDHKSFVFTSHGKAVVEMAKALIHQANDLVNFSKSQGVINKGNVYLGCIPTIAPFLLTDMIDVASAQLPDLEIFIKEDTTEHLLEQLTNGDIDIAILAMPIEDKFLKNFNVTTLGRDEFYLAGDKELVEATAKQGNYQKLPDESVFLLSEEHCLTDHALSACQLVDKTKINHFSATSLATLLQMTIHHKGITFLPEMAINKGVAGHAYLSVAQIKGQPSREIAMLARKASPRSETFRSLANLVSPLLATKS